MAVAITANPGTEPEEQRHIPVAPGKGVLQIRCHLGQQRGYDIEQILAEKIQTPGNFIPHARLFQLQLAGEPQQLDFIAQRADQLLLLARRPARRFELE